MDTLVNRLVCHKGPRVTLAQRQSLQDVRNPSRARRSSSRLPFPNGERRDTEELGHLLLREVEPGPLHLQPLGGESYFSPWLSLGLTTGVRTHLVRRGENWCRPRLVQLSHLYLKCLAMLLQRGDLGTLQTQCLAQGAYFGRYWTLSSVSLGQRER